MYHTMGNILTVTILAAVLLALAFAGIAIKMLVRKNGEFKRHCSSTDPYTGKNAGCICGKPQQSPCPEQKKHTPLEVNDELLKEC
ncbi:MAG: hypothetical protein IKX51_05355 [Bacteroidales bacterium]|nr:hypothetical protein [Bacteroidales bacterium]